MGVFGGIIIGFFVVYLYKCFLFIELYLVFGFFLGKWFVLIIIFISLLVIGVIFLFVWLLI